MKFRFIILILSVCLICFVGCRDIVINNQSNIEASEKDDEFDMPVATEPMKHKSHTHEHSGLACCPCGVCHKHDDDEENSYGCAEFRLWMRIVGVVLFCAVTLSVLHL